jgi:hypothetical protein
MARCAALILIGRAEIRGQTAVNGKLLAEKEGFELAEREGFEPSIRL